ncbi:hypothetical protein, partial [Escherichia coli]|uniref:hypothetical protein n=1 Tax=Escherichia coli TaxID=562 RepID=UPI003F449F59
MEDEQTVAVEDIQLEPDMTYREVPIAILGLDTRRLRNKLIPMVKVQWSHHTIRETTWETENDLREKYPEEF